MLFEYTQMDAEGTKWMHRLGIPTYVSSFLLIWAFPYGKPFLGLVAATACVLAYQYIYCKCLYFFVHRLKPRRPDWQFMGTVIASQLALFAALYAAA
jgi:hypothetical protein